MQRTDVVIGIDGGGTHTRVIAADIEGNILAYCKKGSASAYRDSAAQHNVRSAITAALESGGIEPGRVIGMAAGVAGYDLPEDLNWILPLTGVPELTCPRWHVNDALIAHYGAHLAQPGIIVISGTGSIIIAINEDGRYLRNYDFHHYAASAARLLSYDTVFEVLAASFTQQTVPVAFIGSVANSSYFQAEMRKLLKNGANKQYTVVTPQLPPEAGAVLYALEQLGRPVTENIISRLQHSSMPPQ